LCPIGWFCGGAFFYCAALDSAGCVRGGLFLCGSDWSDGWIAISRLGLFIAIHRLRLPYWRMQPGVPTIPIGEIVWGIPYFFVPALGLSMLLRLAESVAIDLGKGWVKAVYVAWCLFAAAFAGILLVGKCSMGGCIMPMPWCSPAWNSHFWCHGDFADAENFGLAATGLSLQAFVVTLGLSLYCSQRWGTRVR
jgi:hypothetical protein